MSGALFGEVQLSLFVVGAFFGEVQLMFFVSGALFGEVQCQFSWQAQYLVKFGMIAGARSIVILNRKSLQGGLRTDGFTLGSCSDRPSTVNDVFGVSFFVAGAVFGDLGG